METPAHSRAVCGHPQERHGAGLHRQVLQAARSRHLPLCMLWQRAVHLRHQVRVGYRLELGVGGEQRVATAYTAVDALIVQLVVLAGEGRLRAFLAGDRKLLGSELALPSFVALDYFFSRHNSYSLS